MAETTTTPRAAGRRVDPITASVIHGALEHIAIEMGYKLMRMSYSSIIRESEDFGAALIDVQGRQLCETRQSTPLQSGPIAGYVVEGHMRFGINNEPEQAVPPGGTFFEPQGALHSAFGSANRDAPTRVIGFMVVPKGSRPSGPA